MPSKGGSREPAVGSGVAAMAGAVVTVQVVETVFVTALSVQMSLPLPLKVVVTEQALAGTV